MIYLLEVSKKFFCVLDLPVSEISLQGEGALLLVQLSISFLKCCFEDYNFYFLLFQQLSFELIDNCTSSSLHWSFDCFLCVNIGIYVLTHLDNWGGGANICGRS